MDNSWRTSIKKSSNGEVRRINGGVEMSAKSKKLELQQRRYLPFVRHIFPIFTAKIGFK